MAWYKCLLHGSGYPGELADEQGAVGFFVVRFIEAERIEDVERKVLIELGEEKKLKSTATSENARLSLEEVYQVSENEVGENSGFIFYKDE